MSRSLSRNRAQRERRREREKFSTRVVEKGAFSKCNKLNSGYHLHGKKSL